MEIKFEGYRAVEGAQLAVAVLAWICLIIGIIFLIIATVYDGPIGAAAIVMASSIPLFITKAVLKGLKYIVYASEKYIENEIKKSTAKEE